MNRLLHRTTPFADESLNGFLMRVAANNKLLGVDELLAKISARGSRGIRYKDIPDIAFFFKNTIAELSHLHGFEQSHAGEAKWRIGDQWLTKSVFVNLRNAKVCPQCLANDEFLRGIWELSFYSHCAWHEVELIDTCPNCMRAIKWNRRFPGYCGCGQKLANVDSQIDYSSSSSLSKIIAYQLTGDFGLISQIPVSINAVERLANLSLDGICKTIWFLGHCVSEIGNFGSGHGRRRPDHISLNLMAERTFSFLSDWPDTLGQGIWKIILENLHPGFSMQDCNRLMGPANSYFRSSLDDPELKFLTKSYQQYLELIWRTYGKRTFMTDFEKQLLLPF